MDTELSPLQQALSWHMEEDKALSKYPPSGDNAWRRMRHAEQIIMLRAGIANQDNLQSDRLEDLERLMRALAISTHARAESPAAVFQQCLDRIDAIFEGATPQDKVLAEVAAERRKQTRKGYDAAHDDMHTNGEIARAAASYAVGGGLFKISALQVPMQVWPYQWEYNPKDNPRENAIRAIAMLVAEVERLDRRAGS